MTTAPGAIYTGHVVHRRLRPKRHLLNYRVFSLLLDLDRLDEVEATQSVLRINRWGVLSFHERDHGNGQGRLRSWVDARLREAGYDPALLRVRVLAYPRILGYVFNPLTVYFCDDEDGATRIIMYQVNNTFGERHTYVVPAAPGPLPIRQSCDKAMYVSPFTPMDCRYDFSVVPPSDGIAVSIHQSDSDGPLLNASFAGRRERLTSGRLCAAIVRHPLMTLKVIAGIHYEAFRLWRKGVPYFSHEPQKRGEVSVIRPGLEGQGD
ncbi:MAG: DUF1365 domain-containing protein [Rhodospirillales bacterium]|nr:DUF1365 domain-containing protein [Rhodospirillales bacterium]MBO6785762.1 DUF1365 domain-containing protein [Rhodospirillales bacterium]